MEQARISSPQGTQPAHAARSRSTAQAPDAQGAAPSGFLALLAALGDGAAPGEAGPLDLPAAGAAPADGLSADAAKEALDASALAAWQGLLAPGAAVRSDAAGAAPGQGAGLRIAVQDGTAAGSGMPGAGAQSGANPLAAALPGVDGLPQGMVAETAMLDASADLKGGAPQAGAAANGRAFSRMQSALAQRADSTEMSLGRARAGDVALSAQGHQAAAVAAVQAASERMAAGLPVAGAVDRSAAGGAGDPVANGAAMAGDLLAAAAPARGGDAAGNGGRPGEGRGDAGAWFDNGGGVAPVEPGAAMDGPAAFGDPAQAGMEDQVAEQVTYWINQKTQNAELTLNRDGQPVEVSVSLSGNEAHVTFRSDQPQTRDMLDRSMAQLSELLRGEGLVLSGMSVGTSAGQQRDNAADPGRQGRRDGSRQAQVVAAAPVGTASPLRGGGAPDRAVDIFV